MESLARAKHVISGTKELFGGPLRIILPADAAFRDMAEVVPIPDNQEVFEDVSEGGKPAAGQLIIEILEMTEERIGVEAIRFCFDDLASANNSEETTVIEVKDLTEAASFEKCFPTMSR